MGKYADLLKDAKERDEYLVQATDGPAPKLAKPKQKRVGKPVKHGPREAEILKAIMDYLEMRNIFFTRENTQGTLRTTRGGNSFVTASASKGKPDITGALHPSGRYFGIEVKRPGGMLSVWQERMLEKINQAGGIAFVATDVDTVDRVLRGACVDCGDVQHRQSAQSGISRNGR